MIRHAVIPIDRTPAWSARHGQARTAEHLALNAEDGTLQLLRFGFLIAGVAAIAMALALWVWGGIGPGGARSTAGWLALMVALMSMPFGLLLLLLGGAKWMRNHWISRHPAAALRR